MISIAQLLEAIQVSFAFNVFVTSSKSVTIPALISGVGAGSKATDLCISTVNFCVKSPLAGIKTFDRSCEASVQKIPFPMNPGLQMHR